jgi:hypothetical protein
MRGLLPLVAIGTLILAAAVWYLLPAPSPSVPPQPAEAAAPGEAKPAGKPKTTASEAARARKREASRLQHLMPFESTTAINLELSPDMTVRISVPPVPAPQDLKPGMGRNEIVKTYGPPVLSTTQSSHGILMERYFYLDGNRSKTTVAMMENGRVVSAAEWPR